MAKQGGRTILLYTGSPPSGTLVAGGTSHRVKITNTPIDITDKATSGWRQLLDAKASRRMVEISFDGFWDDTVLTERAMGTASGLSATGYVEIAGLGTISGTWLLTDVKIDGPEDDATKLSGTLKSSGDVTWTAA